MHPLRHLHESRAARSFLRKVVPAAVILLAVAGSGDSIGSGPSTETGVRVTKSVPFAWESIGDIRARAPFRAKTAPENRVIPLRRIQRSTGTTGEAGVPPAGAPVAAPSAASTPAPSAPVLDASFKGLVNPTQGDVIPPDTMGAVGPAHLVSLLNSDFAVFSKSTGALVPNQKVTLQTFWESLGTDPDQPAHFPFDPKILYDQYSGRFVAVTLGGTSAPDSWVMVAVSSTSDPTGVWGKWPIDADRDGDVQQFQNSADFPALGVDAFNIYVTANMFNLMGGGEYSKVWVIPKAQLLGSPPPSTITWFEFRNSPGFDFTMQPAHTFVTAPAEYVVYEGTPNHLAVGWFDNVSGTPVWHSPLQVPVAPYVSTPSLANAPQAGNDNGINTSDTRLLNAVFRNGALWTVHTVAATGTTRTEVAWYRIDPSTGTRLSQGRIGDPTRWYYYPSVAVNADDVAAIGFSGSSTREYAGGYYTVVRPPYGAADPVALLKSGEAPYYKSGLTFGGTSTENRWGDFSATAIDPTDDLTFWTLQEYADLPISGKSQWGTWWGSFHPSGVAAPSGLSATAGTGIQVTLAWTDESGNELGFRIERRRLPAGAYSVIATVGAGTTTFADNTDTGLAANTDYFYRVASYDAGGGAYSNEAFATTSAAAPPSGGGGGGGGCSVTRSGGEAPDATSLAAVGILLLPACALGVRRFFRRRERTAPIRHPLC